MQIKKRTALRGGLASFALLLGGCGRAPRESQMPAASFIEVSKSARRMVLQGPTGPIRSYAISLGFTPEGHKTEEGDGRTPEGLYFIDRKNPRSNFHLSLGISYPNRADLRRARAEGVDPGGDIFIHGEQRLIVDPSLPDWTAGCIAVTNPEIEEIYGIVRLGTPIRISA